MRMAIQANASTYLVADIDRGGVFGSVYGTIALLKPEERAQMKGVIINKFRGDASLFEEGRTILKELTGLPVVGVIPWFRDIKIEEEDSVALDMKTNTWQDGKINVAIILLKRMSNFTDFDVLDMDPRFNPYYTSNIDEIEKADIILLPGSKNTLADLQSIRANGIADTIVRAHKRGKKVIGICGGYQMMGARLEDPEGIEGNLPAVPGLGLLPQCTVIEQEKVTKQSRFTFHNGSPMICKGYEIHMGQTSLLGNAPESPVALLEDGRKDGYYLNDHCWGSYMHGILDNPEVLDNLAEGFNKETDDAPFDYAAFKEEQYDKLAGKKTCGYGVYLQYAVIIPTTPRSPGSTVLQPQTDHFSEKKIHRLCNSSVNVYLFRYNHNNRFSVMNRLFFGEAFRKSLPGKTN